MRANCSVCVFVWWSPANIRQHYAHSVFYIHTYMLHGMYVFGVNAMCMYLRVPASQLFRMLNNKNPIKTWSVVAGRTGLGPQRVQIRAIALLLGASKSRRV